MNPETAFIAFGSNQGNRQDFCDRTIALMELLPHSKVIRVSSYYETEPVDMEANPDDMWFYNGLSKLRPTFGLKIYWPFAKKRNEAWVANLAIAIVLVPLI